jgi:ABC-type phosphate/phosphonate transport system substrate-binding protein
MKRSWLCFMIMICLGWASAAGADNAVTCIFPPGWEAKGEEVKAICDSLSQKSGIAVKPLVAKSYPQLFEAFTGQGDSLVYAGSFVQAIINARGIGTPLVQVADGKELYGGVMIYPKGQDPAAILKSTPEQIAYAVGASSGESAAKAATEGKAAVGVANHNAAAGAVAAGKAKAAFVKSWWWAANQQKFADLSMHEVAGVSDARNPDNILTASKTVPADVVNKMSAAALASKEAFKAQAMVPFSKDGIAFSLALMKKGKIDPLTYTW